MGLRMACGIGDKASLWRDVFIGTLQQVDDGDDKSRDFCLEELRVHRREVKVIWRSSKSLNRVLRNTWCGG